MFFENSKKGLKSVVKIQHLSILIKIRVFFIKNSSYFCIKPLFIINNKQTNKQTNKGKI